MFRKTLLIMFMCSMLHPVCIIAQAPDTLWARLYGSSGYQSFHSVIETNKYSYAAVGTNNSLSNNYQDIWLVFFDDTGDTLFSRTYGGTNQEVGSDIEKCGFNDGYIITGYTGSYGEGGDVYLIRVDINGDTLWCKNKGGDNLDFGYAIEKTLDGGFIIVGWTKSFGNGGEDIYIIKTDYNGQDEWSQTFGGAYNERGYSVTQTSDGGYLIGGTNRSVNPGNLDYCLVKLDGMGNYEWQQTYDRSESDEGLSVLEISSGGYIIAGRSADSTQGDGWDTYVVRTDELGNVIWTGDYGCAGWDSALSIKEVLNEGFIISGYITGVGTSPVYVNKIDYDGNWIWSKTVGDHILNYGYDVIQTEDGRFLIVGCAWVSDYDSYDSYIIMLDREVGIDDINNLTIPAKVFLGNNYPNPFNASTIIRYDLPSQSEVSIDIYDILGRHITTLEQGIKQAGSYQALWHAGDVSSGVYFYKLTAGDLSETKKMMLVK